MGVHCQRAAPSATTPALIATTMSPPTLSSRGCKHASKVTAFWATFDKIIGNAYCPDANASGIVNMAISNNYLLEPELLSFFGANLQMQPVDLTYGTSLFGSHRLFASLCRHFNSGDTFAPVRPVEPAHLITGPGCGPLLDQLAEHLAEPGDGVLVAAPYYNGYDADLACRSGVQCVGVTSDDDDGTGAHNFEGESALRGFVDAKRRWEETNAGQRVRAVLVCNPHNPAGRCYDREALLAYGRFAEQHDVHLVFDEIFALSVYQSAHAAAAMPGFHSALSIDWQREAGCDASRVHVVWSASKDFGVNGLRVGTVISQANDELLRAMKATAKLYMISSPADALFCALIDKRDVYADFIRTNQARMAQAYDVVVRWCAHHRIAMATHCNAGHFVLLDLARFLPHSVDGAALNDDVAREGALWTHFLTHAVCLTPGSNYHCARPGTFRMTFTLRRRPLLEGLARIESALGLAAWPGRQAALEEEEAVMETIRCTNDARATATTQTSFDSDLQRLHLAPSPPPPPPATDAQAERQDYVDAVRKVLAQGGGSEALLSCGMGMSCSACA